MSLSRAPLHVHDGERHCWRLPTAGSRVSQGRHHYPYLGSIYYLHYYWTSPLGWIIRILEKSIIEGISISVLRNVGSPLHLAQVVAERLWSSREVTDRVTSVTFVTNVTIVTYSRKNNQKSKLLFLLKIFLKILFNM